MPSIQWRRLDLPGTDDASLEARPGGYVLRGHARFQDTTGLADLHYEVQMDGRWHTRSASIHGSQGVLPFALSVRASGTGDWWVNGAPCPAVVGCIDFDLAFTPATNLLSMRRLALPVGQRAEVSAAWLEYPEQSLKPLLQIYHHRHQGTYQYDCPEIDFHSSLEVRADGFVVAYPPLWEPLR